MRSVDFCYWLMGFFELSDANTPLTEKQVQTIKNHLRLVFLHEIDPSYSDNKTVQKIFQNIHDGKQPLYNVTIENNVKPVKQPIQYGSSDGKIRC